MLQFEIFNTSLGEIMAFFHDPWIVGWVLVGTGIIAAAWLLERIVDPIPLIGDVLKYIIKFASYFGFFVGILDILVGYVIYEHYVPTDTTGLAIIVAAALIVAGFSLTMRILTKLPLAIVFALAVAAFGTFTIYGILSNYQTDPFIGQYVVQIMQLKWMLVIGIVIFSVVYTIGGLILGIIELIGRVFASRPVSILIGLGCIAIGIVVLVSPSTVGIVEATILT
ncbi:MAG: hypothetical protein GF309_04615 [Candidatus Lokiarchaeota archaeon]|jgi:hypothetical protein|nr:hypothetical protein [Candidatus Lokiarchaeota archaeon]